MASTRLTRTPASAGDRRTWTWSGWIKRGNLGSRNIIFAARSNSGADRFFLEFRSTNDIQISEFDGAYDHQLITNRLFRDTSAWYHLVIAMDSTQATASDRLKLYVNGVQETSFATEDYPSLNYQASVNSNEIHAIGSRAASGSDYFDGSMTHVHFTDGTAYDADTFGETDATTGIWKPKTAPSVTYGTNGFFLKFENSGAFGTDSSGNGNTFTVNGTMTQTIDTPSNVFATLNPLYANSGTGFSNGNLTHIHTSASWKSGLSNLAVSKGKYYFEVKFLTQDAGSISRGWYGICDVEQADAIYSNSWLGSAQSNHSGIAYGIEGGVVYSDNVTLFTGTTPAIGSIIGIAVDLDNNYIYFSQNGTWINSGDPTSGASGTGGFSIPSGISGEYVFGTSSYNSSSSTCNFGNGYFGTTAVSSAQNPDDGIGIFEYDVPAGYRALCTKSINAEEYS